MPEPCRDCPFNSSGPGLKLRRSLAPGRMAEIKRGLLSGGTFQCHKTTRETGDGSELLCAGALDFQEEHGASSQLTRIFERLDWISQNRRVREGSTPDA
jgi:hypothetical protein